MTEKKKKQQLEGGGNPVNRALQRWRKGEPYMRRLLLRIQGRGSVNKCGVNLKRLQPERYYLCGQFGEAEKCLEPYFLFTHYFLGFQNETNHH